MSEYITFDQLNEELRKRPDLVEVVRCRDCRHFKPGEEEPPVDWCCYFHDEVTPLGFCAWGEQLSTCRNESAVGFLCSSCSFGDFGSFKFEPRYCPNCGAKVVEQ